MKLRALFFGERSVTKVAAVYDNPEEARIAADAMRRESGMEAWQVRILRPGEPDFGAEVEPEDDGIWHTVLRAHATCGAIGLGLGLLLYWGLLSAGQPAVASSPWLAALAIGGFGMIFGLIAGGAVSMRPDHTPLISAARKAVGSGRWAVVGHPVDEHQAAAANLSLHRHGHPREAVRTF
ncbi:hypothetical protein [Derxia gummosa]|uniref:Uncharacterized protein n=1 Tax=Derxia gummosa DSM 723 TaxID=1121388 RepID=A0A8B6X5U1_9BURK|nr:hypothetical protein [Derxia gummosa]